MRKTRTPSILTQGNIQIYYLSRKAFSCSWIKVKKGNSTDNLLNLGHYQFPWKIKATNYKKVSAALSTRFVYTCNKVIATVRDRFTSLSKRIFVCEWACVRAWLFPLDFDKLLLWSCYLMKFCPVWNKMYNTSK